MLFAYTGVLCPLLMKTKSRIFLKKLIKIVIQFCFKIGRFIAPVEFVMIHKDGIRDRKYLRGHYSAESLKYRIFELGQFVLGQTMSQDKLSQDIICPGT